MSLLLVYGDSLCIPRPFYGANIKRTDIYPYLLVHEHKIFYSYINFSRGAATIYDTKKHLLHTINYYAGEELTVIIAVGLVDAAPRPIPEFLRVRINTCKPAIKEKIVKFISKKRNTLQKIKTWHITPIKDFIREYDEILNFCLTCMSIKKVLCVNISPPSSHVIERSISSRSSVLEYNKKIKELICKKKNPRIEYVDVFNCLEKNISSGNFSEEEILLNDWHNTKQGHKLIADLIAKQVKNSK